jgi:hypothetical protein
MAERAQTWHVPVRLEDVPDTGLHLELAAPEDVRSAVVAFGDVTAVSRLEAVLDCVRQGETRLRVTGRVTATVEQTCVVTLEPVTNEVDERLDVVFAPTAEAQPAGRDDDDFADDDEDVAGDAPAWDDTGAEEVPEALSADGTADVGAIAVEFLLLGINPFPRKPGAAFVRPPETDATVSPFADLASRLKGKP